MDIANIKLFTGLLVVLGSFASTPAQSALILQDWLTPGDGYIVRDTNTNLEWLNLTQSNGLSYSYVTSQFGSGGQFEGMRYASNNEVITLWASYFGIDLSSTAYPLGPEVPGYRDPGVRLASEALGTGISGGTDPQSGPNANYNLIGITGDIRLDTGHQFILGARTMWSDTLYYSAIDPWYSASSGDPAPTDAIATGSYLVRPSAVPVPAAIWLFVSGGIALFGSTRRRVA